MEDLLKLVKQNDEYVKGKIDGKLIIAFDLMVWNHFYKEDVEEYNELKNVVSFLQDNNKIICPISEFLVAELLSKVEEEEHRKAVMRLLMKFSRYLTHKKFEDIVKNEIFIQIALFFTELQIPINRKEHAYAHFITALGGTQFLKVTNRKNDVSVSVPIPDTELDKMFEKIVELLFDKLPSPRSVPKYDIPFDPRERLTTCDEPENESEMLKIGLDLFVKDNEAMINEQYQMILKMIDFSKIKMKQSELNICEILLKCPAVETFIKIESKLLKSRKGLDVEHDLYDVRLVSNALPFVDVFVSDGRMVHYIRELELDKKFDVKVFNSSIKEITSLSQYLKTKM